MKGYIQNSSPVWSHVMKREVGPGAKIELDDLYEQYGKRHNISEGKEFVGWLKSVKLKGSDRWKVIFEEDVPKKTEEEELVEETDVPIEEVEEPDEKEAIVNVVKIPNSENAVRPLMPKEITVKDVVELSVRKARIMLPTVRDLNLLKYALQEANQRANKDSLCRLLRKRIQEIQIAR